MNNKHAIRLLGILYIQVIISLILFPITVKADTVLKTYEERIKPFQTLSDSLLLLETGHTTPILLNRNSARSFISDTPFKRAGSFILMLQKGAGSSYDASELMKSEYGIHSFRVPDSYMTAPDCKTSMNPTFASNSIAAAETIFEQYWSYINFRLRSPVQNDTTISVKFNIPVAGMFYYLDGSIEPSEEAVNEVSVNLQKGRDNFFLPVPAPSETNDSLTCSVFGRYFEIPSIKKDETVIVGDTIVSEQPIQPGGTQKPKPDEKGDDDDEMEDTVLDDWYWSDDRKEDGDSDGYKPHVSGKPWGRLKINFYKKGSSKIDDGGSQIPFRIYIEDKAQRIGDRMFIDEVPQYIPHNTKFRLSRKIPACSRFVVLGMPYGEHDLEISLKFGTGRILRKYKVHVNSSAEITLEDPLFDENCCDCDDEKDEFSSTRGLKAKIDSANVANGFVNQFGRSLIKTDIVNENGVLEIICNRENRASLIAVGLIQREPWRRGKLPHNNPYTFKDEPEKPFPRASVNESKVSLPVVISHVDNIQRLIVRDTPITKLTIEGCRFLKEIVVYGNSIEELEIINCGKLETVIVPLNRIKTLKTRCCQNIRKLICSANSLSELELKNFPLLKFLDCSFNDLDSLDLRRNPDLKAIACIYNNLKVLDMSNNGLIHKISCSANNNIKLVPSLQENAQCEDMHRPLYYFLNYLNLTGIREDLRYLKQ